MNKFCKILLAAAAVTALAAPAMAADKLIVKNAAGTADVFKVGDTGIVNAGKIGLGVTTPEVSLHAAETTTSASRGLLTAQHNDGAQASYVLFRKSRGTNPNLVPQTLNAGAMVLTNDFIASLDAQGWDGYNYVNSAGAAFQVDGTVVQGDPVITPTGLATYPGRVPMAFVVLTGNKTGTLAANGRGERFRITSDGRMRLSNQPAAPANNATCTVGDMILDAPNGFLYLCTATNSWKRTSFAAY